LVDVLVLQYSTNIADQFLTHLRIGRLCPWDDKVIGASIQN
jgi:hypothetical protein